MQAKPDFPQAEISNGAIRARLYLPDAQNGYYRGTRFDWSGVIASLEFAGHNYYGPWFDRMDPAVHDFIYAENGEIVAGAPSASCGPAEEFSTAGKALGYAEAKPGETFVKIGVGALRKPDDTAYDEYRVYEIADHGRWTVRAETAAVEFTQELSEASGYGYRYTKTVRLVGNGPEMVLEHSLQNTGRKKIESSVYNHNFLVLDGQAPGPDFRIALPFELRSAGGPRPELAEIRGRELTYKKKLEGQESVAISLEGFGASPADYDIRVENAALRAGVRITADRPLDKLPLWSIRSVLSIEPFLAFAIEPGAEFAWNQVYSYYTI
jgi:hypothetical protein